MKTKFCFRCGKSFVPTNNAQIYCGNEIKKTGCARVRKLEREKEYTKTVKFKDKQKRYSKTEKYKKRKSKYQQIYWKTYKRKSHAQ